MYYIFNYKISYYWTNSSKFYATHFKIVIFNPKKYYLFYDLIVIYLTILKKNYGILFNIFYSKEIDLKYFQFYLKYTYILLNMHLTKNIYLS